METAPVVYTIREHFEHVLPVWEAFFAGQISAKKREDLLAIFRRRLETEVPLPK